jgi:hypothetical protein
MAVIWISFASVCTEEPWVSVLHSSPTIMPSKNTKREVERIYKFCFKIDLNTAGKSNIFA